MKKVLFFLSIIVMMFLVFGCASRDNLNFDAQNTNTQVVNDLETSETSTNIQIVDDSSSSNSKFSISNIQAEYDTSAYNFPMSEALEASKEILDRSVKSNNFVSLSEEDKWQGWIGERWNVPSYIYGTTSNCDDKLVINGEDLGTLQNLVYKKGSWNNYDKAIFEYNGDIYYVLGLSLATQDDLDCVFLSRDKKDNKDFSEFTFWEWEKGLDGNFHRSGNLGIACTFRNVKMQDGSYATVTIGGYNYSNFGQRVWIKPSTGNDVKVDYPEKNESNSSEEFVFETKIDMDKYFTEKDEANFIFEYTNKTGKDVTICNLISGYRNIFTKTNEVTVKDGATVFFYYNVDEMIENFDENFKFYNSTSGKPDFSYYRIGKEMKNKHVKVTMTNDPENGGEKHEYIQIDYPEKNESNTSKEFAYETKTDMDKYFVEKEKANFIFEYTNKTGKDVIIYNFIYDSRLNDSNVVTKTEEVTVKADETVSFYYDAEKIINDFDDNFVFANETSEKGCAWYYTVGDWMKNQHVKVTMTNDPENGGEKHEYIQIDYPEKNESNTSEEFAYETKTDMDKYFVEKEKANFIFEYTNKTGKDVTIYNFIYDSRLNDSNVVTKTEEVTVKADEIVSFYYDAEKIINDFDDNFVFANYVEEKQCYWWYYYIGDWISGEKVVVTMTNDPENGGEKHEYILEE